MIILTGYVYFAPGRGTEYCHQRVCLSLCLSVCPIAYLENHTSKFYRIFRRLHATCGRGSAIL